MPVMPLRTFIVVAVAAGGKADASEVEMQVHHSLRSVCALLAALLASLLGAGPASAAASTLGNWNSSQQRASLDTGVMTPLDDGHFHGERPLSAAQTRAALSALAARFGSPAVDYAGADPPSVATFDALVVRQLGLGDLATRLLRETARAGLRPRSTFGTEVVARLAGLRFNHPAGTDTLELYPWQPITRAEAAYTFTRVAGWDGSEQAWVRAALNGYELPSYTARQRQVLRLAVSKVGMPYVWGGETDTASSYYGGQVHGGYDCSGFSWRLFKLTGNAAGRRLYGRTAAQQAGEIRASQRIRLSRIEPGDLLFFGPGLFEQRATERRIDHMGIALSSAFMLNSASSYAGVSVAPLRADDGRGRHFSWARRLF